MENSDLQQDLIMEKQLLQVSMLVEEETITQVAN